MREDSPAERLRRLILEDRARHPRTGGFGHYQVPAVRNDWRLWLDLPTNDPTAGIPEEFPDRVWTLEEILQHEGIRE